MSTVRTCTEIKDGWGLYHHFLSNLLLIIRFSKEELDKERDKDKKYKHERAIDDAWSKLVGSLYITMCRMKENGHTEDALNMQKIVDMVVKLDLTDLSTHDAIFEKEREYNKATKELEKVLRRYQK